MLRIQQRILKAARQKYQVTYKDEPIRKTVYLPAETLKAKRAWTDIF
jgi:hypothetical protein